MVILLGSGSVQGSLKFMDDPTPANGTIRETTIALATGAVASALVLTEGEDRYHAEPPTQQVRNSLAKLLELDTIDAVMQIFPSIIKTVQAVITNTARRDAMLGRVPNHGFVTTEGLGMSLTYSLNDLMIALADVANLELPMADEVASLMQKEASAGTLKDSLAGAKSAMSGTKESGGGLVLP